MSKFCPECNQTKLLIDFYPKQRKVLYPNNSAGYSHICKECVKKARALYVVKNKDKCNEGDRKYHLSKYGLTVEDYNRMFAEQEGKCKGCETHQSELKRRLVVDHCHKTGAIRGLLCWQCNSALGMLQDNKNTLANLIDYLKNSESAGIKADVESLKLSSKEGYLYS